MQCYSPFVVQFLDVAAELGGLWHGVEFSGVFWFQLCFNLGFCSYRNGFELR